MNKKFIELQQEVHRVVSAAQRDRDKAHRCQERLAGEMSSLTERLRKYQERYQAQVSRCCGIQESLFEIDFSVTLAFLKLTYSSIMPTYSIIMS